MILATRVRRHLPRVLQREFAVFWGWVGVLGFFSGVGACGFGLLGAGGGVMLAHDDRYVTEFEEENLVV